MPPESHSGSPPPPPSAPSGTPSASSQDPPAQQPHPAAEPDRQTPGTPHMPEAPQSLDSPPTVAGPHTVDARQMDEPDSGTLSEIPTSSLLERGEAVAIPAALPAPPAATSSGMSEGQSLGGPVAGDTTTTAADGDRPPPAARRWWKALLLLVLALRAAVPFISPQGLKERDPDAYWRLAKNLWRYETFGTEYVPTAYRPPLYPILLAPAVDWGTRAWLAIAGMHAVLALLTVLLTWSLARELVPEAAWLAALLVAWDPILVRWSAEIMTETLATFLAVLFWVWCVRAGQGVISALFTGMVAGTAALCRPTFLPLLPAGALVAYCLAGHRGRGVFYALLLVLGGVALLLPWWLRNEREFRRFIPATTHGGYTLYLGNNPEFYRHLQTEGWSRPWSSEAFDRRVVQRRHAATLANEADHDRAEYALAWQSIQAEPAAFLRACLYRLSRLWGVMPLRTSAEERPLARAARWTIAAYYAVVLLLAAAGLVAVLRSRQYLPWLPGLLLMACLTLIHTVYWSDLRMRAPLVPAIALLAAHALCPAAWSRQAETPSSG
jgi:hypothetical protein